MRSCLAITLFLTAASLCAQTRHPFTFDDMMKLKRVEEPQVSPDGKWVLFAAVDADLAANTLTPHVWVVPLNAPKAGSSTQPDHSQANDPTSVGMTEGKERKIISDQDADRPRWAPDGKRFAFISKKDGGSQVWIADFDESPGTVIEVYKLTSIATEASGELWSPDGKNILFVSNVYPECGGAPEAEAACNAKKLEAVRTSPVKALVFDHLLYRHWNAYKEGKRSHLLVVPISDCVGTAASAVQPGEAGPTTGNENRRASLDRTAEGGCPHMAIPRDLTPGDYDAPPFTLGGQDNYAFSPDGKEVCYTSNHDPDPAISTNNDLFTVRVEAGGSPAEIIAQTKNITAENKAADETPLYSPDGRYIAYRAQQRPGYESDRWRLMLYDRKTGEKKSLTENFDRWVGSFTWTPDSRQIYFAAENKGYGRVFRSDISGRNLSALYACNDWRARGTYDDLQFSLDGRTLMATRSTLMQPNEIDSLEPAAFEPHDGKQPVCVSTDTPPIKETTPLELEFDRDHPTGASQTIVGWKPIANLNNDFRLLLYYSGARMAEPFWFRGADGDPVEGFIVSPPDLIPSETKKYPLKFLIHGGPQGAWGDDWSFRWNPELLAANGYVVIMINFHGSTGYGQKFIDAINGDWGGAPFEDLMKGLDYAEQNYPFIDKDRECALGASFGGYMVNWILGHTNRFKCIVSHDGMFNTTSAWGTTEELWFPEWEFKGTPYTNRAMYDKWSPHLSAANFKTPTLVIHGQLDYRLDVSEGFQLFTTLQRLGVPSKMLYFPDEGHWVLKPQNSQLWYKTVNDWVDQWVGK